MAKFVTFIADPELESSVIKAIASINGELAIRGVSLDQVRLAEQSEDITLVCTRNIDFAFRRVIVDKSMSLEEISELLSPQSKVEKFKFDSRGAEVICFVGLSGGVGTTTIAVNYAFEQAQEFQVIISDLDNRNPDVARALGLHRIEGRNEKVTKITRGTHKTKVLSDDWTVVSQDKSRGSHFENSYCIAPDGKPFVLTALDGGKSELGRLGVEISTLL